MICLFDNRTPEGVLAQRLYLLNEEAVDGYFFIQTSMWLIGGEILWRRSNESPLAFAESFMTEAKNIWPDGDLMELAKNCSVKFRTTRDMNRTRGHRQAVITRLKRTAEARAIRDAEQFCKQLDASVNNISQLTGVDTFSRRDDAVKVGQFSDMFDNEYELIY